jgi:phosphate transport system ATP-binding protein
MKAVDLTVKYGPKEAVQKASLDIFSNQVTALIGPSGCGKSSFLRSLNRMNDTIDGAAISGQVLLEGRDIYANGVDPVVVRRHVGMVFQRPNRLVEVGETMTIFTRPKVRETEDYITGRFG